MILYIKLIRMLQDVQLASDSSNYKLPSHNHSKTHIKRKSNSLTIHNYDLQPPHLHMVTKVQGLSVSK